MVWGGLQSVSHGAKWREVRPKKVSREKRSVGDGDKGGKKERITKDKVEWYPHPHVKLFFEHKDKVRQVQEFLYVGQLNKNPNSTLLRSHHTVSLYLYSFQVTNEFCLFKWKKKEIVKWGFCNVTSMCEQPIKFLSVWELPLWSVQ